MRGNFRPQRAHLKEAAAKYAKVGRRKSPVWIPADPDGGRVAVSLSEIRSRNLIAYDPGRRAAANGNQTTYWRNMRQREKARNLTVRMVARGKVCARKWGMNCPTHTCRAPDPIPHVFAWRSDVGGF